MYYVNLRFIKTTMIKDGGIIYMLDRVIRTSETMRRERAEVIIGNGAVI